MSNETVGRVLARVKDLGMNPRSASIAAGLNATFIRDMVKRPGSSPSFRNMQKLAEALQTTVEALTGDSDAHDEPVSKYSAERTVRRPPGLHDDFVLATYGGTVEAGTFREVGEFNDPDRTADYVPRDERFPNAAYFIFDVAGDSMNAADPPMKAGTRLIAVALEHFRGRLLLQTGHIVVVERSKDDGAYRERSVKQIELDENETRFCPRSTNSRHKPIVVPKDYEPDEATKVEVLGVVIDVISKVKMP